MTLAPAIEIDEATAARFAMYHMLTDALEFPTRAFWEDVGCGMFADGVRALVEGLPYGLGNGQALDGLADGGAEYIDFQAEYIRLFDVGVARPPCPLYGGEWGMPRRRSMEDALRFYGYFGLKMNDEARELPDHVTVQLEFMQVMTHAEGEERARGTEPTPMLRAERDFLQRHLARWWPLLRKKIGSQQPSAFYDALTALTEAFVVADHAYVRQLAAAG
ncbi:MAG TPA: molecular chaperone TorD family protein [Dehalococcoidia bacterium]|nr:molecular chaperone TorD family protein [Dehalococcoidia bacterium]